MTLCSRLAIGKYVGGSLPEGSRFSCKEYTWLKELKEKNSAWQASDGSGRAVCVTTMPFHARCVGAVTRQFERVEELFPLAKELGCTPAQLAVAWCVKNEHVSTVILGATKVRMGCFKLACSVCIWSGDLVGSGRRRESLCLVRVHQAQQLEENLAALKVRRANSKARTGARW